MATQEIPQFAAEINEHHTKSSFTCPECGKLNVHNTILSRYVESDCGCWPNGYYLEIKEPQTYTRGLKKRGYSRIPTFEAQVRKYNNSQSCMVFQCPSCGKNNIHSNKSGHHTSDCGCWKNGYYLKKQK